MFTRVTEPPSETPEQTRNLPRVSTSVPGERARPGRESCREARGAAGVCALAPRRTVTPHRPPSISDVVSLDRGVQHIRYNDLKDQVPKEGCKISRLKCDYIDYMLK